MLGICDNYKTDTAVESGYDDEDDEHAGFFDSSPQSNLSLGFFSKSKEEEITNQCQEEQQLLQQLWKNALHFASVAASNAEKNAAKAASDVAAFTNWSSIPHNKSGARSFEELASGGEAAGRNNDHCTSESHTTNGGFIKNTFGRVQNLAVSTAKNYIADDEEDYEDDESFVEVENMNEDPWRQSTMV